jgi:hypothetical protein
MTDSKAATKLFDPVTARGYGNGLEKMCFDKRTAAEDDAYQSKRTRKRLRSGNLSFHADGMRTLDRPEDLNGIDRED